MGKTPAHPTTLPSSEAGGSPVPGWEQFKVGDPGGGKGSIPIQCPKCQGMEARAPLAITILCFMVFFNLLSFPLMAQLCSLRLSQGWGRCFAPFPPHSLGG